MESKLFKVTDSIDVLEAYKFCLDNKNQKIVVDMSGFVKDEDIELLNAIKIERLANLRNLNIEFINEHSCYVNKKQKSKK